jgi:hypothetical protein
MRSLKCPHQQQMSQELLMTYLMKALVSLYMTRNYWKRIIKLDPSNKRPKGQKLMQIN